MTRIALALTLLSTAALADTSRFPSLGGDKEARVTILAFINYQCPYSKRISPVLDNLLAAYGDQLRVTYRNLPFDFFAQSRSAAAAALCAHSQGGFKAMHDGLLENQEKLSRKVYTELAAKNGLGMVQFLTCLDSPATAAAIQFDIDDAEAFRVNSTPTIILMNNAQMKKLPGGTSEAKFREAIDAMLKPGAGE